MADVLADLVQFFTSGGSGALTVVSAVNPFMTPAQYNTQMGGTTPFNSGTCSGPYSIVDPVNGASETGEFTYTQSTASFTRAVQTSTNSGSAITVSTSAFVSFTAISSIIVKKTGDTMTGLLILSGDPVAALGAVTKQYADASVSALSLRDSCAAATATILANTPIYSNGSSGVGATLTGVGFAGLVVDGYTAGVGDRILIKNQVAGSNNGIYSVTATGGGAAVYVLTRVTDYDQAAEIFNGTYTSIFNGTVNADTTWGLSTTGAVTVGTTSLAFTEIGIGLSVPIPAQQGGTGVANNTASTITISGSYGLTFTLAGATSVALPASGTLIGTAVTAVIVAGYTVTDYSAGTFSSGTYTPVASNGNYQLATNNGAHTLAAPAADSAIDILYTNGASAGSITFSGFSVGAVTGDPLTTTNTNKFIIMIRRMNGNSTYSIKALQ